MLPLTGERTVATQWMMRGTHSGPFIGIAPTGYKVALPGADFIAVEGHKICSVQGYFDQRTLAAQLGLQVIVQPYTSGPVSFGTSVFLQTGKHSKPGAFSLTSISLQSDAEKAELQEYGRRIMTEMVQMPGLISAMTVRPVGHRSFTIAAWEDLESPRQMARGKAHQEAMERFFGPDFAASAMTSVWVPHRLNTLWVRCTACKRRVDAERQNGQCQCGQPLPEPPPYW
jgi:hypothetical protein